MKIKTAKCIFFQLSFALFVGARKPGFLEFAAEMTGVKNKKDRVKEVIELVGLGKEQNKIIESLSKGYRQRVGLAHAIIHDPEVLILDEVNAGVEGAQGGP